MWLDFFRICSEKKTVKLDPLVKRRSLSFKFKPFGKQRGVMDRQNNAWINSDWYETIVTKKGCQTFANIETLSAEKFLIRKILEKWRQEFNLANDLQNFEEIYIQKLSKLLRVKDKRRSVSKNRSKSKMWPWRVKIDLKSILAWNLTNHLIDWTWVNK